MKHHMPPAPRGLATFSAVMLMAFIGVALVGVGQHVVLQVRRTQTLAIEVQLRQLLLAATWQLSVEHTLTSDAPWEVAVTLPESLAAQDAAVRITAQPQDAALHLTLSARLGPHHAREVFHATRQTNGHLTLTPVSLELPMSFESFETQGQSSHFLPPRP